MPDYRLPRGSRLRGPGEFKAVFAARRVLRGRLLNVHALPAEPSRPSDGAQQGAPRGARLGFVIGKRHCPLANRRNLLRRLIRERFRRSRSELGAVDLVFRLSQNLPRCTRPELRTMLRREIETLFRRIHEARSKP